MSSSNTGSLVAYLELHAAVLLFGLAGLFGKLVPASPTIIVFGRVAIGAVAILLCLRFFRISLKIQWGKPLALMLLSGLVLALHWLTFFHAIQVSTVAVGLLGYAAAPVFVTLAEPLLFGHKFKSIDLVSAVLVVVGLTIVAPTIDFSNSVTLGLSWAVLSGALFALLTLMNRHITGTQPPLAVAFFQQFSAALVLLPFVLVVGFVPDQHMFWLLMVLGVLCTALPQVLYIKSLGVFRAQLVSVVAGLEPVYGILLALVFLGEVPSSSTVLGGAVVLSAVILATRSHNNV